MNPKCVVCGHSACLLTYDDGRAIRNGHSDGRDSNESSHAEILIHQCKNRPLRELWRPSSRRSLAHLGAWLLAQSMEPVSGWMLQQLHDLNV
ncbi:MAG: hypothetical protein JWN13_3035 [Betaproteobacteria bacterium]|nr:hypothetical protein [Betaproteobacteria bacterium]